MKTYSVKAGEIQHDWFVVDARDQVLGRLATRVASVLRGKHKPTFSPHLDVGDYVVVVNAPTTFTLTATMGEETISETLRKKIHIMMKITSPASGAEKAIWSMS